MATRGGRKWLQVVKPSRVRSSRAWLPDDSSHALGGRCVARACPGVMPSKSDVLKDKLSKFPPSKIKAACEELLEAKLPNKRARM